MIPLGKVADMQPKWASEDAPRTTLRVIAGGAPAHVAGAHLDGERWMNEGGSFTSEAVAARRATSVKR